MREIKFRVWNKKEQYMYNPSFTERLMIFADGDFTLLTTNTNTKLANNKDSILMQYTGLKDKKGKEIYEGDICEFNDYSKTKIIIIWDCKLGCWGYKFIEHLKENDILNDIYPLMFEPTCDCDDVELEIENPVVRILGNIYENQELMEDIK